VSKYRNVQKIHTTSTSRSTITWGKGIPKEVRHHSPTGLTLLAKLRILTTDFRQIFRELNVTAEENNGLRCFCL